MDPEDVKQAVTIFIPLREVHKYFSTGEDDKSIRNDRASLGRHISENWDRVKLMLDKPNN